MDAVEAERLVSDLWPELLDARERSRELQRWALGRQELPVVPDTANSEYRSLQERAITPWLSLVVQSVVQALHVEGYRRFDDDEDTVLWSAWQANRMDARQAPVYEAACTTGVAYVAVLPTGTPGERRLPKVRGEMPVPEWRTYSSTEMIGFYEGPHDEWPTFALTGQRAPRWQREDDKWFAQLLDGDAVYTLRVQNGKPAFVDAVEHGIGHVPVARFVNRQTISGRAIGEVEPYTAVAARIDQDEFDRMIVQRFGSWRVRYATGMVTPATEEERRAQEMVLQVSSFLTSDSTETQFGSLPETPLDGHLRAPIGDVRALAAVSQTPPTVLTGDLSNISADALAAVEAAFNRKIELRKMSFGESWEQCFDLTARLMGLTVDHAAQVQWRDMESRSLAQTADALGKLAQSLELPVEVLWDKLGFLTDQDRQRARELRAAGGAMDQLLASLTSGLTADVADRRG